MLGEFVMNENWKFGEPINYEATRPFSPLVLKTKMTSFMVDSINEELDRILGDPKESLERDGTSTLAGNLQREEGSGQILLKEDFLRSSGVGGWLSTLATAWKDEVKNDLLFWEEGQDNPDNHGAKNHDWEKMYPYLTGVWCNNYIEGDFNPMHWHPAGHISGVGFLKIPDDMSTSRGSGELNLMYGSPVEFTHTLWRITPEEGDFYFFPAWMIHSVNPFRSKGERRSMSFNAVYSTIEPEEKKEE